MRVPVGPWEPDKPSLSSAARAAKNVIPVAGGYGPLSGPSVISNALTGRCLGATAFRDQSGAVQYFSGDATKLYRMIGASWSDVSGSTYGAIRWRFAQFGNNVLAVNGSNIMQSFNLLTSSAFEDISGAPRASDIAVVRDFVVVVDPMDNSLPLKWSGNNDSSQWTIGEDSAGAQPFPEGGQIKAVTGGEYGLILQDDALTRMTFVGGDVIFQFDRIETARGCVAAGSVAKVGQFTFYLSRSGFELFNGVEGVPIGHGRIDTTFFNDLDSNYTQNVTAAIDHRNKLVVWAYPNASATSGLPNKLIIYSWGENRWSEAEVVTQTVMGALTEGTTLEGLDASSTSTETLTPSLDSEFWKGGNPRLGSFDTSNRLNFFVGDTLASNTETGEVEPSQGRKTRLRTGRGLIDGPHTITVSHRNNLSESLTAESAATPRSSGRASLRSNNRYFRFKVSTTEGASWSYVLGVDIEGTPGGR